MSSIVSICIGFDIVYNCGDINKKALSCVSFVIMIIKNIIKLHTDRIEKRKTHQSLVIVLVELVHVVVALSVAAVSVPSVVVSATAAVIMLIGTTPSTISFTCAVNNFFHLDLFHHGGDNRFIGRQ